MPFIKWPDIESLHNVVRGMRKYEGANPDFKFPVVTYRGKVKLDGTNAAVRITRPGSDGFAKITAQSRTQDISISNDNCGFARFVEERRDMFIAAVKDLFEDFPPLLEVIIYGEWAGKGIQKGTSVSTVDGKYFCVFAVQEVCGQNFDNTRNFLHTELDDFPGALSYDLPVIGGVRYLGWEGPTFVVDFGSETSLRNFSEKVEAEVLRIEGCDPWVKTLFGVEGVGEGLVYYPTQAFIRDVDLDGMGVTVDLEDREEIERLMFKAKGEKHRVKKQERPPRWI